MEKELIEQANKLIDLYNKKKQIESLIISREFIKSILGENSSFYKTLHQDQSAFIGGYPEDFTKSTYYIPNVLNSFIDYIEGGFLKNGFIERKVQIETVSDYLIQANTLLEDKDVHAAIPIVIIGASLEQFLRNWLEQEEFDMSSIKSNITTYGDQLKKLGLIGVQDIKEIIAWNGKRNSAAHGKWEEVDDKKSARMMLDGVNLFMQKYSIFLNE